MTIYHRGKPDAGTWSHDFHYGGDRYTVGGFGSGETAEQAQTVARVRLLDQRLAREVGIRAPGGDADRPGLPGAELSPEHQGAARPSTYQRTASLLQPVAEAFGTYRLPDITTALLESYRDRRASWVKAASIRMEWAKILP